MAILKVPNDNTILILPAVSSANVPQLAIDLIIHSLQVPFYSLFEHNGYLYPFAGPRETFSSSQIDQSRNSQGVSSSLEIYHSSQITCLVQRAPTLPNSKNLFINKVLLPFIYENSFSRILFLSSSDASRLQDPTSSRVRLVHLPSSSISSDGSATHEEVNLLVQQIDFLSVAGSSIVTSLSVNDLPSRLPGSGITLPFLKVIATKTVSIMAIIFYVFDGDNTTDAQDMARIALRALGIQQPQAWVQPLSWDGIYGKSQQVGLELGMYG
ncbi:proteasome assembly chaperone 2 [Lipomyces japonicus]|uniref:proteasome assembly chaperone 2 n=1 Tax=Lipomyces japonicus TaxID=56871 RepID=UPI0034CEBE98